MTMMTPPPTPPLPGSPSPFLDRARSVVDERDMRQGRSRSGSRPQQRMYHSDGASADYHADTHSDSHSADRQPLSPPGLGPHGEDEEDVYGTLSSFPSLMPSFQLGVGRGMTPKPRLQLQGHSGPHFNARKASERLRSTEGYVSFASVEGLGEPPETPVECAREERGRKGVSVRGRAGAFIGWVFGGAAVD